MPLADLQLALLRSLQGEPPPAPATLTLPERRWLDTLTASPGFLVTREIRQWWRAMRLQSAAPLTLRLLRRGDDAAWVERYLATARYESLFFLTEALALLDALLARPATDAGLRAVAEFERALLRVQAYADDDTVPAADTVLLMRPDAVLVRHPLAVTVTFPVRPERLLGALLQNAPVPPNGRRERHSLLIAPGVARRWRPASPPEVELLARLASPTPYATVRRWPRASRELVVRLYQERALTLQRG